MTRALTNSFFPALLACVLGLWAYLSPATATAQSIETCNITGSVKGNQEGFGGIGSFNIPLGCANSTTTTDDRNEKTAVNFTLSAGALGISNLGSVSGLYGLSEFEGAHFAEIYTGKTKTDGLSVLGNSIQASTILGGLRCTLGSTDFTANCDVGSSVDELSIAGLPATLSTARNYEIPVEVRVPASVLWVPGLLDLVRVRGSIILNQVIISGLNTRQAAIETSPLAISVSTSFHLAFLDYSLQIDIKDYAKWSANRPLTDISVTDVPITEFFPN